MRTEKTVHTSCKIQFPNLTKEQRKYIFNAEKELKKAGVEFDTGYSFKTRTRDWEFDWSLSGARVIVTKPALHKVQ